MNKIIFTIFGFILSIVLSDAQAESYLDITKGTFNVFRANNFDMKDGWTRLAVEFLKEKTDSRRIAWPGYIDTRL